jgi:hypothetical protein
VGHIIHPLGGLAHNAQNNCQDISGRLEGSWKPGIARRFNLEYNDINLFWPVCGLQGIYQ